MVGRSLVYTCKITYLVPVVFLADISCVEGEMTNKEYQETQIARIKKWADESIKDAYQAGFKSGAEAQREQDVRLAGGLNEPTGIAILACPLVEEK